MAPDTPDPSYLRCLQNHRLSVNWISFSPNSKYLASASDDKNVIVWSLADKSNVFFKYGGHKGPVTSVALANSLMVSGSKDCTARLWRISDPSDESASHSSEASVYRCHQSPINCVDIKSDGSQFCTSSDDKTVKLWSTSSTNKFLSTLGGEHTNWVRHARFGKLSENLLASCGDDGLICVWDLRNKEAAIKLKSRRKAHLHGVEWHPNCEYLLSSSSADYSVRLWDLRYEKIIQSYQVHDGFVTSTAFHPSGNYLISSSVDQTSKILDLYEGRTLFTLRAHTGHVNCAQFSPKGDFFATAGQDHSVLYWQSNLHSTDCDEEDDEVRSLPFDPATPPLHKFSRTALSPPLRKFGCDELKSPPRKMTNFKLEFNSPNPSDEDSYRSNSPPTGNHRAEEPKGETSFQFDTPSTDRVSVTMGFDPKSVDILKCILSQLEVISDSILNIDRRLSVVENRVAKMNST